MIAAEEISSRHLDDEDALERRNVIGLDHVHANLSNIAIDFDALSIRCDAS